MKRALGVIACVGLFVFACGSSETTTTTHGGPSATGTTGNGSGNGSDAGGGGGVLPGTDGGSVAPGSDGGTSNGTGCAACRSGFVCTNGACTSTETCPAPTGAPADATTAITAVNAARAKMGSPCASVVPQLDTSATKHCAYVKANAATQSCISNVHVEVMTCTQYVAAQFYDRMAAAGYAGTPASEDMAEVGDPSSSVQEWIDSVWHRAPLLSPWVRDLGYGSATGCDTIDMGVGASSPETVVVVYPYDGQTSVPPDFSGAEGPTPPAPPTGFPSGYPIHVWLQNGSISVHTLTLDGTTTPIPHVFFGPNDPQSMGYLRDAYVMYANAPLASKKKYRVHVEGKQGQTSLTLDWAFTTE